MKNARIMSILLLLVATSLVSFSCQSGKASNQGGAGNAGNQSAQKKKADADKDKDKEKQEKEDKKKETIYSVAFHEVGPETLNTFVNATATLRADREVEVFSKAAGQIRRLSFEEGQYVEKGTVLLALDGDDARLELEQIGVNLKRNKSEFKRTEKSYQKALISQDEFEAKRFDLERIQAEYDSAKYKLSVTKVIAPFSGTIIRRHVELGQTIQPSDALFTLAALDPLEADVFLTESQVTDLKPGQRTTFSKNDDFEQAFKGSVVRIAPIVDRETGTIKVTVAIPEAPAGIRPGTYAHLRIRTNSIKAATTVPKKALVFDSRQKVFVFLAEKNEDEADVWNVKRTEVQLGTEESGTVQITDGLQPGDQIVLTGKEALKEGSKVKIAQDTNQT